MRTFRRVTLFCSFGILGAGLAFWVGFSTIRPSDQQESKPLEQTVEAPDERPEKPETLPQPPLRGADLAAPWPALLMPANGAPAEGSPAGRPLPRVGDGPAIPATSYPALAQQFAPEADKSRMQKVRDYVEQQLGSPPSATPPSAPLPAATPRTAAEADGEQIPAAAAQPHPEPPVSKAKIDEEGDGKLAIRIQDADIREVLDLLGEEGNLNILAGHSVQGKVSATLRGVDIEGALDAILKSSGLVARREGRFIFVGTPADFDSLEQAMDKVGTRVYRPNYVTAAELQTLIQPLLTPTTGVVSVSTAAEVGIKTDDAAAGGDKFAGGDVVVVRDYRAMLAQIDQVVKEIDQRPAQVAIEAMILSVKLDDKNQFGVDFQLLRNQPNVKLGWGTPPGSLGEVTFEKGGLKFGFLDSSLGAFLNAVESIGDTNVIATPRLMVLNKQRAEIQIGEEKGYVSLTTTETSSTQSVEFLKLGAQLRLRPFISSDGLIRMEIHPELSDGAVDTSSGYTLPNKEVTQVTTNIMVRDGCTVVIGGLMREQLGTTTSQVPLLGSLPLVGFAFRNKQETTERRELLVLITPRIVYEPGTCHEGDKAACEFHRRQAVYADQMSPIGKRSLGRKYFRLAQEAWAAGDREKALRFVELSIHFDPLSRAAIDLRSDIWLGRPQGDHTLGADAQAGPTLSPMDGETIPAWLLDDLEHEPPPQPPPVHPLDPGRPGSHTDIVRPRRLQ
jgi:type IV pilus assembly protein PilQ